jgi:peptidyl-prolyl cis-trans isomerase B (cyclophilin B)
MNRGLGLLALLAFTATAQERPPTTVPTAPEAVIETELGSLTIRLRPDLAPKHVAYFLKTAKAGGFDGTTFHRIIAGGIVQGGDPFSKDPKRTVEYGRGGLGVLKAEFSELPFTRGVVAAVRRPSDKDSAGTQFFIVLAEQPSLKGQYTIFAEVVSGMDVADKIGSTPVEGDRAARRVEMKVKLP